MSKSIIDKDLIKLQQDAELDDFSCTAEPWDNPFEDNPDNDDDTCQNPEGCDDGGPEEASEACYIDVLSDSKTEVYMLAFGFIEGLYHTENYPIETGCTRCRDFAFPLANF